MQSTKHKGKPWRLVIVDDHELARAGLRSIFETATDFTIVGEMSSGHQAVEMSSQMRPDLILMDVQMPEMDGLAATRAIKNRMPEVCVIIVTMHESPDYLLEALRVGASGYILKEASRTEIVTSVRQALQGERMLNGGLAVRALQHLASEVRSEPAPKADRLTRREHEVLVQIITGKTNREIGAHLGITSGTVKIHVERIIAKLGVSDRTQAAVLAIELGLHKPPPV